MPEYECHLWVCICGIRRAAKTCHGWRLRNPLDVCRLSHNKLITYEARPDPGYLPFMTNVILAMGGSRIGLLRADCRETEGCGHAPEAGIQIELACEFADCPPCRLENSGQYFTFQESSRRYMKYIKMLIMLTYIKYLRHSGWTGLHSEMSNFRNTGSSPPL